MDSVMSILSATELFTLQANFMLCEFHFSNLFQNRRGGGGGGEGHGPWWSTLLLVGFQEAIFIPTACGAVSVSMAMLVLPFLLSPCILPPHAIEWPPKFSNRPVPFLSHCHQLSLGPSSPPTGKCPFFLPQFPDLHSALWPEKSF